MPDNKLTCTDEAEIEQICAIIAFNRNESNFEIAKAIHAAMQSSRPIPTGYEELRERLRQTELKRSMRLGFSGMVAMDYGAQAQEVLVNPDGPEAADAITTLLTKLAEVEARLAQVTLERDESLRGPLRGSPAMRERKDTSGAWGAAFLKWLAKGCDHGDAAYRADQAEKRAIRKGASDDQ